MVILVATGGKAGWIGGDLEHGIRDISVSVFFGSRANYI
jgi:hypothetical protein